MSDVKISRALLSVSNKTGLAELGQALARHGVELVSTGGTAKALRDIGLEVRDISDLTGFPEMMDGRVKTLHPKVHGGLLAVRDDPAHAEAMTSHGIGAIDLVVVNLYPFAQTVACGAGRDEVIENIDIGGPSMVRSAAKNHAYVAIVTDPEDYASVLNALEMNFGSLSLEFRRKLAAKATATALFVGNDQMALGVLRAFAEAGIRVPDDVSVVGFDDQPESEYFTPPLTTVRQDFEELGRRCMDIMLKEIEAGASVSSTVVTPLLVARASTAPPPGS